MKTEFEAKFLGVDMDAMRRRLAASGFVCVQPDRLMRRNTFNFAGVPITGHYARVRDEGDKVTMTVKRVAADDTIARVTESEIVVASTFDEACAFLVGCGCEVASYQETRREEWRRGKTEACLDTWPGLRPFLELEAHDEAEVKLATEQLGLPYGEAVFGAVGEVYVGELGYTHEEIMTLSLITFEVVPPRMR